MRSMFYVRSREYKAKKLKEEVIIFDAEHNRLITLNTSAKVIWSCLWKKRSEDEVVRLVAKHYGITSGEIRKDVITFLRRAVKTRIFLERAS